MLTDLLIHTVDVETQVNVKTVTGGIDISWIDTASGLTCRVDTLKTEAILAYAAVQLAVTHRVYFDADPSLSINDRLVFAGEYYNVRAINNAGGNLDRIWQIDVERGLPQ